MTRQSYRVLARKWRPQRFADVVGQPAVVRTLANALDQGRTAHAYCFSGIRGVGKTTIARLLAKGLNCRSVDAPTSSPCGECESCVEIMAGRSMDVFERDAASDRGINEMKELIEIARYAPSRDRYKVMILDEAHMLTPEASNALLKVLEEPPEYIAFVLATTEANKILPTILSRCQHYQFARISQRDIAEHLGRMAESEGVQISPASLALVATAADGSLRDAQSLLDKLIAFAGTEIAESTVVDLLGLVDRVLLYRAIDLIAAGDAAGVMAFVNEMVEQGIELHQFTVDLIGHVRDLLVVRTVEDPAEILHLPEDDLARLRTQAEPFTIDDLDRAFQLLAANEYRIKMAEQPRYHLEVVLARLARMPRLEPIEEVLAALRGEDPGPSRRAGGGPRSVGGSGRAPGTAARPEPASRLRPVEPPRPAEEPPHPAETAGPATTAAALPPSAAIATQTAEAAPAPAPAAAAPTDPPTGGAREMIQRHLEADYPLAAQVLGRAVGIDIEQERVTIRFPRSAAIFAQRVQAPEVQGILKEACAQVVGRPVAVRVDATADPAAVAEALPAGPDGGEGSGATPAPQPVTEAGSTRAAAHATATAAEAPGAVMEAEAHEELRRRAEQLPLVQDLVRELKGQVISVEEL